MPENFDEEIDKTLHFNPLAEAEEITGKSYKNNEFTSMLGFMMAMEHNEKKTSLLEFFNDSTLSMNILDYIKIVEELGQQIEYKT